MILVLAALTVYSRDKGQYQVHPLIIIVAMAAMQYIQGNV